jgi:hypothetical protein
MKLSGLNKMKNMERIPLSSLFLIAFIVQGVCAQVATDSQVERLQGRVKTMQVEAANLKGTPGKWQESGRGIAKTFAWDQKGFQTEQVWFGSRPNMPHSDPLIKIVTTYNASRKVQTEKSYDVYKPDPANRLPSFVILDVNGKPVKPSAPPPKPKAADGAVINQVVYKFDRKGNLEEKLHYDGVMSKGKLSFKHRYSWDEQGRLQEEASSDSDGKLTEKYIYKYDSQGNELEQFRYDEKGQNVSRETYSEYKFDAQGNWIQRVKQMDYVTAYGQRIKTAVITYRIITYWQ